MEGPARPAAIVIRILSVTSVDAARGIFCKRACGQGSGWPQTAPGTPNRKILLVLPCLFLQTDFFAPLAAGQNMAALKLSSSQETGLATRMLSIPVHFQAPGTRIGHLMAV